MDLDLKYDSERLRKDAERTLVRFHAEQAAEAEQV